VGRNLGGPARGVSDGEKHVVTRYNGGVRRAVFPPGTMRAQHELNRCEYRVAESLLARPSGLCWQTRQGSDIVGDEPEILT